jgi:methylthioribulose-1-phosphate dehydratase
MAAMPRSPFPAATRASLTTSPTSWSWTSTARPSAARPAPSAETLLHTQLYRRFPEIGCVLHTHSRVQTVASRLYAPQGYVRFEGYELQKAFGQQHPRGAMDVPVLPNTQDMPATRWRGSRPLLDAQPLWGYLIDGHGLYAWGRDMAEARRHLEAFEFLLDCELDLRRTARMSRLRIFDDHDPGARLLTHRPRQHRGRTGPDRRALRAVGGERSRSSPAPSPRRDGRLPRRHRPPGRRERLRSVDVVSIAPGHPEREAMRAKFLDEHYHKEDEVRFFVAGSGLFTLHVGDKVYEMQCVTPAT